MDLKQIEAFVTVAELGSFTKAASALGIAQPLLSRHVRQLEIGLHQNLLLRNGRGVTVTEAGLVLLEHGRGILHQVEVAKEVLGSVRGALSGRISIGLPPSLSKLITVALTLSFREYLPQAKLSLTEGFSVLMLESLRSGRLDMALLYNPPHSPDIEMALVHEEALVLISGKGRALETAKQAGMALKGSMPLASLGKLPLIVPSRPNAFRLLIDTEMQRINVKPQIVLEIDGLNAILELVREGMGFAVLPAYTLRNFANMQEFNVHRIEKPQLLSQLMLVHSAKRPMTATHLAAQKLIEAEVSRALLKNTP